MEGEGMDYIYGVCMRRTPNDRVGCDWLASSRHDLTITLKLSRRLIHGGDEHMHYTRRHDFNFIYFYF
jgi:hypothetical protein